MPPRKPSPRIAARNSRSNNSPPKSLSSGYIFQRPLKPHPDISHITRGRISALRVIVTVGKDGPKVLHIICRLPSGANQVDNFRRPGNLIASVDPVTGKFGQVVRGVGTEREILLTHPDTGVTFSEVAYPKVPEAVDLALKASLVFPQLHVQSWDIAVCDDGVHILEMNPGGNFNIVQLVAGLNLNANDKAKRRALKLAA